jgi:hypothetical protein
MLHVPEMYSAIYCVVVSVLCSVTRMYVADTGDFQQAYCMEECAMKCSVVPWFTSLIHSVIAAHKAELF